MKKTLVIYSDGGCTGNPGAGAWAAILIFPDNRVIEISGGEAATTNNRMELTAVIKALERLEGTSSGLYRVIIFTDSQYLLKGMSEWMKTWIGKNWKSSSGKPVKNRDLWLRLKGLGDNFDISWEWVRGHSGDKWNERCDALVREKRNLVSKKSS